MKQISLFSIFLLTATNTSFASEKTLSININKIYQSAYRSAKISINALSADAERGDMVSALAIYDFYENIKNPDYKINYEPSKNKLKSLALLDHQDKVHNLTREAFLHYENSLK